MANEQGLSVIRMSYGGSPFYIPYFVKKASFHNKYVELFNETKDNLDTYIDEAFKHVESEAYEQLLEYEYDRFGTRAKSPTTVKENFKSWLDRHVSWMETQFN
jgi:predicted component of type VI protein secretion system